MSVGGQGLCYESGFEGPGCLFFFVGNVDPAAGFEGVGGCVYLGVEFGG